MPSGSLFEISQQIEQHGLDNLGKFYLYAGLLNVIAIRKKSFDESIPTYAGLFSRKKLQVQGLDDNFHRQIINYQRQFENATPGLGSVIQKIAMAYIHKGQLADLVFIIDKMLVQLSAIQLSTTHKLHKDIYSGIDFDGKKKLIYQFLSSVSKVNQHILSAVDSGGNTAISLAIAVAGMVVVLASVFSLAGVVIGTALLAAGLWGVSSQLDKAIASINQIPKAMEQCQRSMAALLQKSQSLFDSENNREFIVSSVLAPVMYGALTMGEQLSFDEKMAQKISDARVSADSQFVLSR